MTDLDQSDNEVKGRVMDEREEKTNEKERGQSFDKAWRRDSLGTIVWASILIWAGVVFLVDNLGLITGLTIAGNRLGAWSVVFAGAGAIVLIEVVVRLVVPAYSRPVIGTFIFGMILLAIGLGEVFGSGLIWAMVLIGVGVLYLVRAFTKRE
jgi:hypothetical protein